MSDDASKGSADVVAGDGRRITRSFDNLEGFRDAFAESQNPIWAWLAINVCADNGLDFPPWLRAYLGACAKRMQSPEVKEAKDFGRELAGIFGFPAKRGPGQPFKANDEALEAERFAIAFARELLADKSPAQAREIASLDFDGPDGPADRTLQRRLKSFFRLNRAPRDAAEWRRVVTAWLLANPWCWVRYKGFPELRELLAHISAGDKVTMSDDGRMILNPGSEASDTFSRDVVVTRSSDGLMPSDADLPLGEQADESPVVRRAENREGNQVLPTVDRPARRRG